MIMKLKWTLNIDSGIRCMDNKAIRDGKYLARHMAVLGNVHPIKIEHFDIFHDVIWVCNDSLNITIVLGSQSS